MTINDPNDPFGGDTSRDALRAQFGALRRITPDERWSRELGAGDLLDRARKDVADL